MKNSKDDKEKIQLSSQRAKQKLQEIGKDLNLQPYEASKVREAVGISQNLLSQWIGRGHVKPSKKAAGQGTRNYFNEMNICQISLFKMLNENGFNRAESSSLAFQTKTELFFAFALASLRKNTRKFAKGELNVLAADNKIPWVGAVYFREEDGTVEVHYIIKKSDLDDLYFKFRQSKLTHIANLTQIAREVYFNL